MQGPLARAAHHISRYVAGFLLILLVLWSGWHVKGQLAELHDKEGLYQYLQEKSAELSKELSTAKEQTRKSVADFRRASDDQLARRISQLSTEIEQRTSQVLELDSVTNAVNPSRQVEIARLNAQISLASQERDYLISIKAYRLGRTECSRIANNCETIRQRHILDYRSYQTTVAQITQLQESWTAQYNPLSQEYSFRKNLEERRDTLALKTQGHKADYGRCLASVQKTCGRVEPPPFSLNAVAIEQANAGLQQRTRELGEELTRHWLKKVVLDPMRAVLPMALQIFGAAILGGLSVKFLLYYVLAPRAARGRPICLIPNARPRETSPAEQTQSRISLSIPLKAEDELLVHHGLLPQRVSRKPKGSSLAAEL